MSLLKFTYESGGCKSGHVYEPTSWAKEGDWFQPLMFIALAVGLQIIGAGKAASSTKTPTGASNPVIQIHILHVPVPHSSSSFCSFSSSFSTPHWGSFASASPHIYLHCLGADMGPVKDDMWQHLLTLDAGIHLPWAHIYLPWMVCGDPSDVCAWVQSFYFWEVFLDRRRRDEIGNFFDKFMWFF